MHPALLIDEILELILNKCSDWDETEYHYSLGQLARACRAWKDPALDRVWKNLGDTKPLTSLLDSVQSSAMGTTGYSVTIPDDHVFHRYATRVRHITLRREAPAVVSNGQPLLPNLTSVVLERFGCGTPSPWIISQSLKEMRVVIGPISETTIARERGSNVADILFRLKPLYSDPPLQKLRIRGWMCPALSHAVGSLSSLQSLSLQTGSSLTPQLLRIISLFHSLKELRVHADAISADDFSSIVSSADVISFPCLRLLHIRGQHTLLTAVLELLQPDTLQDLSLETESPSFTASTWKPTLDAVAIKAATSLQRLSLHQILDLDDIHGNFIQLRADITFTIDTLCSLSPLHALRSFILDTSIPADLTNNDIEDMAAWWPYIEHLDLGTLPYFMAYTPWWQPKITLATFPSLARLCPDLHTLVIPLDLSTSLSSPMSTPNPNSKDTFPTTTVNATPQHTLRRLSIGHLSTLECVPTFVHNVLKVFPSVLDIECESTDGSQPLYSQGSLTGWSVNSSQLKEDDQDRTAATEDGLADGH